MERQRQEPLDLLGRLNTDQSMQDHLRFTRELIALRKHQPALRARRSTSSMSTMPTG